MDIPKHPVFILRLVEEDGSVERWVLADIEPEHLGGFLTDGWHLVQVFENTRKTNGRKKSIRAPRTLNERYRFYPGRNMKKNMSMYLERDKLDAKAAKKRLINILETARYSIKEGRGNDFWEEVKNVRRGEVVRRPY